ncbi:MAG: ketoacyl-ACP synthase III [Candidatus Rokubacteria bacterium]|nr:ketoacyl-ACP synthase III [Candidatus Rokubacteria bacterium]
MTRARIAGVGAYVPPRVLTNAEVAARVDTTEEWIVQRTGIRERHIADETEATSDLAVAAARQALARAGLVPEDVELIVVGTSRGDMPFPSTANFVQHKLGARRAGAMDVFAACAGSVYSLSIGAQYIETGKYRTVLTIGAEIYSRLVDWNDRATCVLFGDGAAATVLRPATDGSGILDADLYSDGRHWEWLYVPGGGSKHPTSHETVDGRLHYLRMRGDEVFKAAVRMLAESSLAILEKNGYAPEQVDLFIPHQANVRIIEAVAKRLGVPMDRVVVDVDRYGNTASASVYLALEEAWSQGRVRPGDLVLLASFGGGFTWGAALVQWS